MGPKRKQPANKQAAQPAKKQAKQDGQKAVGKGLNVKPDEYFGQDGNAVVFIDDDGTIFDAALNQTNVGKNNNKFYFIQLLKGKKKNTYYTHTRWGRVGDVPGQLKSMGPSTLEDAKADFEKKFKDKTGHKWEDRNEEPKSGKYTFLEKNYESDSGDDDDDDTANDKKKVKKEEDEDEEEKNKKSKLPMPTQRLMELIFNENHFNSVLENIGYNNEKLPLGKLSKSTLKKGFEHLQELASLIKHPKLAGNKYKITQGEAIEDFTNKYYSTIPHVFGRSVPPLINNNDILQREVAMLDTLSDMEVANAIMKTTTQRAKDSDSVALVDKRFDQLKLSELTPLEAKSSEYQNLKEYLINTAGQTHNVRYRIHDIFRVVRDGEDARFNKSEFGNRQDTCRRLLWHGSRTTNYGGILSQGLRIAPPEAPVSGYAFGKGIYLADVSTKSANYCIPSLSGGHGLLMLCDAELGRPMYEILTSDTNAGDAAKKKGCIATKGIGRTVPQGWTDASCIHKDLKGVLMPDPAKSIGDQKEHPNAYLQYNEYICYDVKQLRIRYLFRVAF